MFNSLFFRLFLAFWILSAGVLLISGTYITSNIEAGFREFISMVEEEERENLVVGVNEILNNQASSGRSFAAVNQLARAQKVRIIIEDGSSEVIHDTDSSQRRRGVQEEETTVPLHLGESTYPLEVDGLPGGKVTVIPEDRMVETGYFTPLELAFASRVAESILWGGLISLILSAVVSAVISLSISKPVHDLKKAAGELKKGNLYQRAPCRGPKEIKELSDSFNSMAEYLERTTYLKKKLTQDISHELRNPVASARGYLEAFQDGILPPDQQQLEYVMEEISRLEKLAEEIHSLSLADSSEKTPALELTDLGELGYRLSEGFKFLVEAHYLNFKFCPPEERLPVMVDPGWVKDALKNLLQNALRYTPKGGSIVMDVQGEASQTDGNRWAVVSILDDGEGIPEDKLPFIFERFYRTDDSRSRETGGSGLGLSLVKEWTRAMGGEVEAISTEEGSTFKLFFPVCKEE